MTEEMIIDGINVSECGFFHPKYKDTDCHIALAFSEEYEGCMKCENNPNCYFKQLKRAEKKLEKIKDIMTQCNQNAKCGDCKYGYLCKGYLFMDGMILQIIEGEENEKQ